MRLISPHTITAILVSDQDEALQFYTEALGLEKRHDVTFGPGLRLLTVASHGQMKPELALAKPDVSVFGETYVNELMGHLGQQVSSVFVTTNCQESYLRLLERHVTFVRTPTAQLHGVEAVFLDPYGNTFLLLETALSVHSLLKNMFVGTAA